MDEERPSRTTKHGIHQFASGTDSEHPFALILHFQSCRKRGALDATLRRNRNVKDGLELTRTLWAASYKILPSESSSTRIGSKKLTLIFSTLASDIPYIALSP